MTHVTTLRPGLLGSDQSCWVILKSMGGSVLGSSAILVQSWSRPGGYRGHIRQHAGA